MSGYFQRLAQRTGLVEPPSREAHAQRQSAPSANSLGLELEQIVEVSSSGSAPAASAAARERSRHEVTGSGGGADRAMPPPAARSQSGQSRTSLRDPRFVSTAVPSALPAVHDAAVPPNGHAKPLSPIEERETLSTAVSVTNIAPRTLETEPAAPAAAWSGPLEHGNPRLDDPTPIDTGPGLVQGNPLQPRAKDSAALRAQAESDSIETEPRTSSRPQFVTELFGRPAPEWPPTINVRIGSVAVEIHQAALQPTPPPAIAPRPAPPRERFSLSRHYLRMD